MNYIWLPLVVLFLVVALIIQLIRSETTRPLPEVPLILLSMDAKPEMKQLLYIDGNGHKPIRIVELVTKDCDDLGIMLDLSPAIVKIEWEVSQKEPVKKCKSILSKWLDGQGKNPISWRTLISTLEKMEYMRLAQELTEIFKHDHKAGIDL